MQFRDEYADDDDQDEKVGEDGAYAGDLVDPVEGHLRYPAAALERRVSEGPLGKHNAMAERTLTHRIRI